MEKLFILLLFYFSITFSIIGYGNIFSSISNRKFSIGERGLNGILFLIIISYLTNLGMEYDDIINRLNIIGNI